MVSTDSGKDGRSSLSLSFSCSLLHDSAIVFMFIVPELCTYSCVQWPGVVPLGMNDLELLSDLVTGVFYKSARC